jgi:DNA repair exonuclease SbcCD ATPase subunit
LPTAPELLRDIPVQRAQAEVLRRWSLRGRELEGALRAAVAELGQALRERGEAVSAVDSRLTDAKVADDGDTTDDTATMVETAAERYHERCQERAEQARQAATRESLTARLADLDDTAKRNEQARVRACDLVAAAAGACDLHNTTDTTTGDRASALRAWVGRQVEKMERFAAAQKEWSKLQALLGDGSLTDLIDSAREADTRARALTDRADPTLLAQVQQSGVPSHHTLTELREDAAAVRTSADTGTGQLREMANNLPKVAEAEEALAEADREHARVVQLRRTLDLTRDFLRTAQDRVHREIAPVLAETVRAGLGRVTGGRYTDVRIDPATLGVSVRGPGAPHRWYNAAWLSHGTAEQIYLLLRIALATHLTSGHGVCPLLLDDVTVHADTARTRDVLDLLLQTSAVRQVVLFTQEDQVAEWADKNLTEPEHLITRLPLCAAS